MKTLKQRRLELLIQIDKYSARRCNNCRLGQGNNSKIYCVCQASMKIRELGDQLMSLINARAWEKDLKGIGKRGKITISEYIDLQKYDVTDVDIAEQLGVPAHRLRLWKKENNVSVIRKMCKDDIKDLKTTKGNIVFVAKYHKAVAK